MGFDTGLDTGLGKRIYMYCADTRLDDTNNVGAMSEKEKKITSFYCSDTGLEHRVIPAARFSKALTRSVKESQGHSGCEIYMSACIHVYHN